MVTLFAVTADKDLTKEAITDMIEEMITATEKRSPCLLKTLKHDPPGK